MPELSAIPWLVRKLRSKRVHLPWIASKKAKAAAVVSPLAVEAAKQRRQQGQGAEQEARAFLETQGLRFVERNFRCKAGEIDLIMSKGNFAVIVEVRLRTSTQCGSAIDSITHAKRAKVSKAAGLWWVSQGRFRYQHLRFDAVGLDAQGQIQWVQNAWVLD